MTKAIVILSEESVKVPSVDEVHIIFNNSLPMKAAIKVINSIDSSKVRLYEIEDNDIITGILIERITKGDLNDVTFVCDKDTEKKIRDGFDSLEKESAPADAPQEPATTKKISKKVTKEDSPEVIPDKESEEIKEVPSAEVTESATPEAPKKRHRRTKAEIEAERKAKEEEGAMEANKETNTAGVTTPEKKLTISKETVDKVNLKEKSAEVFTRKPKEKVKIEPVVLSGKGKAVAKKLPKELRKYSAVVIQVVEGMSAVPEDLLPEILKTKLQMEMSPIVGFDNLDTEVNTVYDIVSKELGIN